MIETTKKQIKFATFAGNDKEIIVFIREPELFDDQGEAIRPFTGTILCAFDKSPEEDGEWFISAGDEILRLDTIQSARNAWLVALHLWQKETQHKGENEAEPEVAKRLANFIKKG